MTPIKEPSLTSSSTVRVAAAVVTRELPPPDVHANDFGLWETEKPVEPAWRANLPKKHGYTAVDLMAGMGGSSTGLELAGWTVTHAANHWSRAIEGHQENHPKTDHSQCDITQVEPSYFPVADLLWASPECKNHSPAKGKKRDPSAPEPVDEWGRRLDEADFAEDADLSPKEREKNEEARARRSRAMMEDVVRIAEYHAKDRRQGYKYMVIENVPAITDWMHFSEWRRRLDVIGYDVEILSLNSSHAHGRDLEFEGVAQSRDRVYIMATRKDMPKADLEIRPPCYCFGCDEVVEGKKVWKQTPKTMKQPQELVNGTYGPQGQYYFQCPNVSCKAEVEPYQKPAAAVLDLSDTGRTIGEWIDTAKPRKPAPSTLARIEAGIEKYMLAILYGTNAIGHPARDAFERMTQRSAGGLITASKTGLLPHVVTTKRGGGSRDRGHSINAELGTVTQGGGRNFDFVSPPDGFLMRNNTARGDDAQMSTPLYEAGRTLTTAGHQSLVRPPDAIEPLAWVHTYNRTGSVRHVNQPLTTLTTVERQQLVQHHAEQRAELRSLIRSNPGDRIKVTREFLRACTVRMLRIDEISEFMGMPKGYRLVGTKADQTAGMGNAVTPPAARLIGQRIQEALDSHRSNRREVTTLV